MIASGLKGEAKRCHLCGRYASKFCDYFDCPHLEKLEIGIIPARMTGFPSLIGK